MAALTDDDIRAILSQQVAQAAKHDDDELVASRTKALDYFFGRMDRYVPAEVLRAALEAWDKLAGYGKMERMRAVLEAALNPGGRDAR